MGTDNQKETALVESYIKKAQKAITIGDASSATGVPMLEAEYALRELMGKYFGRLEVTENGNLMYDFGESLRRRDAVPFSERMKSVLNVFWKIFKVIYKASITVIMVFYFVLFVAILIAMVVAAMSGGRDSNRGGSGAGAGLFRIIGEMFGSIFRWNTHTRQVYRPRDPWGYEYPHYEPRKSTMPHKKPQPHPNDPKNQRLEEKSFFAGVYDFVFGPPRIEIDPMMNEKELATFVKYNGGVASVAEVQGLAGWTRENAAEFLTKGLAYYNGRPSISEKGTLVAEFNELSTGTDDDNEEPIVWFWDEYEPEWELTGNKTSKNLMIIGMNLFNLVMSFGLIFGGLGEAVPELGLAGLMFLGLFPLTFSFLFFFIPCVRWFYVKKKQREQHIQNIRKRLMKVIYRNHKKEIPLSFLTKTANEWRTTEEVLDPKVVDSVMMDFIDDLGGEGRANEQADVVYRFHRLNDELEDLGQVRLGNAKIRRPGKLLDSGYYPEGEV